ncbi:exonuclease domain-containing protein [Arthrobacter sp. zg-Y826]|uniref:exonuclease domain-containing protein n=1 Tax=Arthrobacter jinronghuae TaxID=2964609 RepID=UPI0021077A54|nr:exonuclease domain-containing protein [Arthrobacter jinronghuae]MCQ1956991.1 exonuclease domain-containing protein [Arthrobacter jinronghuae]
MSGLNFTAIDVETANSQRASVCAVGIVQVRNGEISETFEWHVTPPTGLDSFLPRNIAIHGITPEMVQAADNSWAESLDAIRTLAGDFPLVAYNAPFDKSVIHESSRLSGLTPPVNEFHCALALAKRHLTLEKYRLPLVAAHLGIAPFTHHDAGSDAAACAQVVLALAERHELWDVSALWAPARIERGEAALKPSAFSRGNKSPIAELPQPNLTADSSHPFFGRQVIMTGDMESYDRWEAMEKIASLGGINGKGVTKKTAFLLIGDGKTHATIDLENGTTKERKAAAYMAAGQDLTVLTESDFVKLVNKEGPVDLKPEAVFVPTVSDQARTVETSANEYRPALQAAESVMSPVPAPVRQHEDQDGQYASRPSPEGGLNGFQPSEPAGAHNPDVPEKAGQAVTAMLRAGTRMGHRLFGATKN